MATYLLLWNPARLHWWSDVGEVFTHAAGGYRVNWSCGTNLSIARGDRVFLMRTGREPRGIIAAGKVLSRPVKGLHWEEKLAEQGKTAQFISCRFDTVLNPAREAILGTDELRRVDRAYFSRTPQASGTRIPDDVAEVLEEKWRQFLGTERKPVISVDPEAVEGLRTEVVTYVRGRSRVLRDKVLAASNGLCEACGVDFSSLLGGEGVRVLQVHHRSQLASTDKPRVTKTSDLAVVCANCHALIHMNPRNALKVEVLRKRLAADRTGMRRAKS